MEAGKHASITYEQPCDHRPQKNPEIGALVSYPKPINPSSEESIDETNEYYTADTPVHVVLAYNGGHTAIPSDQVFVKPGSTQAIHLNSYGIWLFRPQTPGDGVGQEQNQVDFMKVFHLSRHQAGGDGCLREEVVISRGWLVFLLQNRGQLEK